MAIDWDETLLASVHAAFAEAATYQPADDDPFPIQGVFDAAYREVNIDAAVVPAVAPAPRLGVRAALFPVPPQAGDRVTILRTGIVYRVREARADSHGEIALMLQIAPGPYHAQGVWDRP